MKVPTIPREEKSLGKITQKLNRLVEISVVLNSTLDLNDLLELIVQAAAELLECKATSILLYDEVKKHLYFAASTGTDPAKLAEIPVPLDNSLAGSIFRSNKPLLINEASKDPRHFPTASKHVNFKPKNFLGVPMQMQSKVIGVLEALNKPKGEFNSDDEEVLSVLASHAAVAINNARLVQELKDAYKNANSADQMKSKFLTLASHELRTPLGIVIGYATFLREDKRGDVSENARHVLNAAMQMRTLLEGMGNLTLLEADQLTYKAQVMAIQRVLEKACKDVKSMADAKAQVLEFDLPRKPILINTDPDKLGAALANVLNNAVRFSPDGGKIIVGAKSENKTCLIWVQDEGIGITPEELENIFKDFFQVETPNTRSYGGLGIGLTIAKGLIEAQGGKIWAESEGEGKGACFKISLPKLGK
ncbi:MAG: GAF domain-containing sensor histidine kinase [Anaerolineales bacterium]|nr:GAF domain-containing sensor histidine kinase [Anaerolineales bacterium]